MGSDLIHSRPKTRDPYKVVERGQLVWDEARGHCGTWNNFFSLSFWNTMERAGSEKAQWSEKESRSFAFVCAPMYPPLINPIFSPAKKE